MIETIDDLMHANAAEIENAKKSIDFKAAVYSGLRRSGTKKGMTLDEWKVKSANRKVSDCTTCKGTGKITEKMRTVGTIHASSATKCVAALYYDVTGEIAPEEELRPELIFTFDIGHAIHERVQNTLAESVDPVNGPLYRFEEEVRVNLPEALICNGSADGDSTWSAARCLLEIKTISGDEFLSLRKPKKEHIIQAAGLYAKGLNAPFISFLYISKVWPHEMKEYVVEYDESVFQDWYNEKALKVEEGLEAGKPPLAKATAYECKSCGYRNKCPQAVGLRDRFSR